MTGVFKELLLAVFSIIVPIFAVTVLVLLGWFLVWKLFLSRFRFVRELLGSMGESPTHTSEAVKPKVKSRRE